MPSRLRHRWGLVAASVAALVLGSCSTDEASPSDRSVCRQLQDMVDALGSNRSLDAVDAYDTMISTAGRSTADSEVTEFAREMGRITDARVDESSLPMSEVSDLARRAMESSGDALSGLVDACARAGLPVDRLADAGAVS